MSRTETRGGSDVTAVPSSEDAVALFGDCVVDATSIVGLPGLVRAYPDDWRRIIQDGTPGRVAYERGVTVREGMVAGAHVALMPRDGGAAGRLLRPRGCAKWLAASTVGDRPLVEIDEQVLQDLEVELRLAGQGEDLAGRSCSLLRRVAFLHQVACGQMPIVAFKAPFAKKSVRRRPARPVPTPATVATVLGASINQRLRATAALVLGCGALEIEVQRVRVHDVEGHYEHIWLSAADGRVGRWIVPPAWARATLIEALGVPGPGDALLLRGRDDADAPATSLMRALRDACERVGRSEGLTMGDLRLLYQAVARARGLSREIVRGSLRQARVHDGDRWSDLRSYGGLVRLAEEWRDIRHPPVKPSAFLKKVPRDAAKGRGARAREVGGAPRERVARPLPQSPPLRELVPLRPRSLAPRDAASKVVGAAPRVVTTAAESAPQMADIARALIQPWTGPMPDARTVRQVQATATPPPADPQRPGPPPPAAPAAVARTPMDGLAALMRRPRR